MLKVILLLLKTEFFTFFICWLSVQSTNKLSSIFNFHQNKRFVSASHNELLMCCLKFFFLQSRNLILNDCGKAEPCSVPKITLTLE